MFFEYIVLTKQEKLPLKSSGGMKNVPHFPGNCTLRPVCLKIPPNAEGKKDISLASQTDSHFAPHSRSPLRYLNTLRMETKSAILSLCLVLATSKAFEIEKATGVVKTTEGQNVTLTCRADSYFEYCGWKHSGRNCLFKWRSLDKSVGLLKCHEELEPRLTFTGAHEYVIIYARLISISLEQSQSCHLIKRAKRAKNNNR